MSHGLSKSVKVVVLAACAACLCGQPKGWAFDFDEFARCCADVVPATERVEGLYRLLVEEVEHPTATFRSEAGAEIDHEYLLADMVKAFWSAQRDSPAAQATLQRKLRSEPRHDARQVMQIALGSAGDKSVSKDLSKILKAGAWMSLRCEAAVALKQVQGVLATPDLIEALQSPAAHMAAFLLERLGVKVVVHSVAAEKRYEADKASAIRAMSRELTGKDEKTVVMAIEGIARIGGEEAKAALRRFIAENERKPGRSALVAKAKKALLLADRSQGQVV